eukprot:8849237-Pyramimonas_sp.AAC.1
MLPSTHASCKDARHVGMAECPKVKLKLQVCPRIVSEGLVLGDGRATHRPPLPKTPPFSRTSRPPLGEKARQVSSSLFIFCYCCAVTPPAED